MPIKPKKEKPKGRKRLPDVMKRVSVHYTLHPQVAAALARLGGNQSRHIDRICAQAFQLNLHDLYD